ncbi:MAG: hypothetical protein KME42_14110 [Tildeniella nuda ZEHNDER 1965/U140]|jgi:hypothetical protein|nr:hypothetical protein [Tildeniella nuda ZEHNDER 1965/U140]
MKVEIVCPEGLARGTRVFVDGKEMTCLTGLTLTIDVDEIARLELRTIMVGHGDQPMLRTLENGDREIRKECLVFTGEFANLEREEL